MFKFRKVLTVLFAMLLLFMVKVSYSQDVKIPNDNPISFYDLGITAFLVAVSTLCLVVVQITKLSAYVNNRPYLKVIFSAVVGAIFTMLVWFAKTAFFMINLSWWQALIQGLFIGLSAAGIYDLIKTIVVDFWYNRSK